MNVSKKVRMLKDTVGAGPDGKAMTYKKGNIYELPFGEKPEADLGRVFVEEMKVGEIVSDVDVRKALVLKKVRMLKDTSSIGPDGKPMV